MNKEKVEHNLKLIGLGIAIGMVIVVVMIMSGAKLTKVSIGIVDFEIPTPTFLPTTLPTIQAAEPLPSTTLQVIQKYSFSKNYFHAIGIANAGEKSVDDILVTISSTDDFPLSNCWLPVPYDNILPRQTQDGSRHYLIYSIPTLPPSALAIIVCDVGDTLNNISNLKCEIPNDSSKNTPSVSVTARDIIPSEIEYTCGQQ